MVRRRGGRKRSPPVDGNRIAQDRLHISFNSCNYYLIHIETIGMRVSEAGL